MLTQARLKELLNYDPDTGVFTCIKNRRGNAKKGDICGHSKGYGYIGIGIDLKSYYAHRLAWLYITGEFPIEIDHINHDKTDNRFINLRNTTRKINSRNTTLQKNNKMGILGIRRRYLRWVSVIKYNYKPIIVYSGNDFFEACCARKSAENKYNFHQNHGQLL